MAFTFFFRDEHLLQLIAQHVIPEMRGISHLRFWDAGCAMGPEPYSLAMICAEHLGRFAFRNLTITATDIDEGGDFGSIIKAGEFRTEDIQRIPEPFLSKYFSPSPRQGFSQIDQELRTSVQFSRHDLLSLHPPESGFHFVMCKNVLLHFSQSQRIEVIRMFHAALGSGGIFCTDREQEMPEEIASLFQQVVKDEKIFRKVESL